MVHRIHSWVCICSILFKIGPVLDKTFCDSAFLTSCQISADAAMGNQQVHSESKLNFDHMPRSAVHVQNFSSKITSWMMHTLPWSKCIFGNSVIRSTAIMVLMSSWMIGRRTGIYLLKPWSCSVVINF